MESKFDDFPYVLPRLRRGKTHIFYAEPVGELSFRYRLTKLDICFIIKEMKLERMFLMAFLEKVKATLNSKTGILGIAALVAACSGVTAWDMMASADTIDSAENSTTEIRLGDLNGDNEVNASDAAMVLTAAASVGAGDVSGLTEEQELAADLNKDGGFNAVDAAQILTYAAYRGSGGTADLDAFLSGKHEEEESTTVPSTSVTETSTTMTTTTTTTQAPISGYVLNDITTNADAFLYFAGKYNGQLLDGHAVNNSYGISYGHKEAVVVLAILNNGYVSDNVLKEVFKDYTEEDIYNGIMQYYATRPIEDLAKTDVNFAEFTIDNQLGNKLNELDQSYRDGELDSYLYDVLVNGNVEENIMYNPALVGMLASYDVNRKYISLGVCDYVCMDAFANDLCQTVFGTSYTR